MPAAGLGGSAYRPRRVCWLGGSPVNGPAALAGASWSGLSAEFRETILASSPRADVELIGRACDVAARCHQRVIVALDIESSTSRPDPVKAELRTMLYELFDAALRAAGISACRRDRFTDRGDGLLAPIDPADQAPAPGPRRPARRERPRRS